MVQLVKKPLVKIGDKFNNLEVIGIPFNVYKNGKKKEKRQHVVCKCSCGVFTAAMCKSLLNNNTKSCGCYQKIAVQEKIRKGTLSENGYKKCSMCGEFKIIEEYRPAIITKDKLMSMCFRCERNSSLLKKYGITVDYYENLLQKQNGVCAICKKIGDTHYLTKKIKFLCVDHNHLTGKIRGLLCSSCNAGLGRFGDSVLLLDNAVKYLTNFLAVQDNSLVG